MALLDDDGAVEARIVRVWSAMARAGLTAELGVAGPEVLGTFLQEYEAELQEASAVGGDATERALVGLLGDVLAAFAVTALLVSEVRDVPVANILAMLVNHFELGETRD